MKEGEFVETGQVLALMQTDTLQAQRTQALAQQAQAEAAVATTKALVAMRESDVAALQAVLVQHETQLNSAQRRLTRSRQLAKEGSLSAQQLEDDEANLRVQQAAVNSAKA